MEDLFLSQDEISDLLDIADEPYKELKKSYLSTDILVEFGNISDEELKKVILGLYKLGASKATITKQEGIQMTETQLKKFYEELEKQNSWGKNQIKTMLLEVIAGLR